MPDAFRSFCKTTLLLFLHCLFFFPFKTTAQAPTHTARFSPAIDANINGFWEYLPRNYATDISVSYPLLIFIHGAGDMGGTPDMSTINKVLNAGPPKVINAGNFPESFTVGSNTYRFIVLSPQIKNGFDYPSRTSIIQPATIDSVIAYALRTYRVDPTRIYLCGLSMGGGATWDYVGSSGATANKLAAIVAAAGAGDLNTSEANTIAAANLPVLAIHNVNDDVILMSRTQTNIANINTYTPAISPSPKAVYWGTNGPNDDKHNVWSRTFEDLQPGTTAGGNLRDTLGFTVYEWLLQFSRTAGALPVVWKNFTVKQTNNGVLLQWTISQQTNVKNYVIEKSKTGDQWIEIATINARQSTATDLEYSFTDNDPFENTYYRIRQNDVDGKFSFSVIRKITVHKNSTGRVYPNPFNKQLTINLAANSDKLLFVRLTDVNGRRILNEKHMVQNGNVITLSNLQHIKNGVYYLAVENEDGFLLYSQQILKH